MTSEPITADQQAAKDDAHLRSLGIKPELKRTLGFLSNFAVAFSYISVSTGTFTNQAVAFGVGGPADLLGVAAGDPRADVRGAELRRAVEPLPGRRLDLPVVEAPVATRRSAGSPAGSTSGPASITVTAVAVTVPLVLSTIYPDQVKLADPSPLAGPRHAVVHRLLTLHHHDAHQRRSASGCWRSSTTSASPPRSSGWSSSRCSSCSSPTTSRRRSSSTRPYTASLAGGNYFAGLPGRHVHGAVRGLRLRHGRHVRRGDRSTPAARRRAASCRRSGCPGSSARSSCSA